MKKDKEKFLQVLADHQLIIFKVCKIYCEDEDDQKDVAQEIIIQLWQSFHRFDPKYKYSTWIYRIALNVSISHLRKSSKRSKNHAPLEDDFLEINEEKNDQENVELLYQFIHQLNGLNKALMLLYLEDKSHQEIAEILNISKSNVGTKISRIKDHLRQQFEKQKT